MGDLGTRFHLSIISPWLLILLNFCSILKFSDAANLYIPDYPTSSCAPSPLPQRKWGPPLPLSPPGEGTATGRLVWVTGKKGSVVFVVFCLREPPPHPSDLIWYHSLFSIPKVSEGFLSFFFLPKHMSLLVTDDHFIWKIVRNIQSPRGSPKGQILILILTRSHRSVWWSLGVFSLLCALLSPLHGSRMFHEKYGSNALELRCVF